MNNKYYFAYEYERIKSIKQKLKEIMELKEKQQKYIDESKQKIDDLLLNCKFESAFEHLIAFLISIEPKYVPHVLAHYDSIIKKHNRVKKIFNNLDDSGSD